MDLPIRINAIAKTLEDPNLPKHVKDYLEREKIRLEHVLEDKTNPVESLRRAYKSGRVNGIESTVKSLREVRDTLRHLIDNSF